ncbi:MAG: hydrogenase maturation nickel metallochaperone HypA [Gaiellales bacterium]
MHELAIAEALVDVVCEHAAGRRVERVEVRVGHLRQVVPEALEFAFELVARETVAEGAELAIERVPVRIACNACGAESELDWFPLACTRCAGMDVEVIAGQELTVEALEVAGKGSVAGRR